LARQHRYDDALLFCHGALAVDPTSALAQRMLVDLEKAKAEQSSQ
jgi:hypothetical protein